MSDITTQEEVFIPPVEDLPDSPRRGRPKKDKEQLTDGLGETKNITITLDNSFEDVLKYDSDGYLMIFDDVPGRFMRLADKQFRELSPVNKGAYAVAKLGHDDAVKQRDNPTFLKYGDTSQYANPVDQLTVGGKDPGMAYSWKRPDQLRRVAMQGWKVDQDEGVDTFKRDASSVHTVGAADRGDAELILHKMPRDKYEAIKKAGRDRSEVLRSGQKEAATREIARGEGGRGVPYDPDADVNDTRHPWSDTAG